MLDGASTMTEIAEQVGFSRSSVYRHSQHRHDRDKAATSLVQLVRRPSESTSLVQVPPLAMTPLHRFARRLAELADDTSRVAELAAATRDPRLYLAAIRSESDQLHAMARSFPADPDAVSLATKDAVLAVVSVALRRQLPDDALRARVAAEINAGLIEKGLE